MGRWVRILASPKESGMGQENKMIPHRYFWPTKTDSGLFVRWMQAAYLCLRTSCCRTRVPVGELNALLCVPKGRQRYRLNRR